MELLIENLFLTPENWKDHFSELLGPKVGNREVHDGYEKYVKDNIENNNKIFEEPLKKSEILDAVKSLKNGKSTSFDSVSNEMIKASMPTLLDPIFQLFSTMISSSLYSSYWKLDILTPVHKKGVKNDPNNYRGIAVASHFGKLFNTVLKNRLQAFCDTSLTMRPEQISGKKGARTADHLTVIRFLIEKYAIQGKKKALCLFL